VGLVVYLNEVLHPHFIKQKKHKIEPKKLADWGLDYSLFTIVPARLLSPKM
jgi:hypothetical protein